jgi:hypothetical protein
MSLRRLETRKSLCVCDIVGCIILKRMLTQFLIDSTLKAEREVQDQNESNDELSLKLARLQSV